MYICIYVYMYIYKYIPQRQEMCSHHGAQQLDTHESFRALHQLSDTLHNYIFLGM